jgi:hypothetical protein
MNARRSWTYHEPYRTFGVSVFNLVGRRLWRWGWRHRLNAQKILDSACRLTGLSDWGDERFREPLQVLVDSLNDEARLSPFGQFLLMLNLRRLAANRLWVRRYVTHHPDTLEQPVPRPLFVVGLPRTGTTLLYNLLCQDSSRRELRLWEGMLPARSVEAGRRDTRLIVARAIVTTMNYWLAPELRTVHPLRADAPEECTDLLCNTFTCPAFLLFAHVSRYAEWVRTSGREMLPWVYEQFRTYLQVLQHQGRRAPWILKSPALSLGLEALLSIFPDACIVQTHRDMKQVVPSTCSLFAIMRGIYSDDVDCHHLGPDIARLLDLLHESASADRQQSSSRIFQLHYRQLVADPIGIVQAIYRFFGLDPVEGMEARMRSWLSHNPAHKHGKHQYDLEQFGLTTQDLERIFVNYPEQFAVAPQRVSA